VEGSRGVTDRAPGDGRIHAADHPRSSCRAR